MLEKWKYLPRKANTIAQEVIMEEINRLNEINHAECFTPGQLSSVDNNYKQIIDRHIDDNFKWLSVTKETRDLLRRLVRYILHRAELSRFRTGIVVAGFGWDDICPTLCSYEIDGIVHGKLKRSLVEGVDIDRGGTGADIKAFAQQEMVERFLQGVDPAYDEYVQNRLEDAMSNLAGHIFQALDYDEAASLKKVQALKPIITNMKQDFVTRSATHKEKEFKINVLNMVQFMPNQELATLAESLGHL